MMVSEEKKKRNVAFERQLDEVRPDDVRVKVIGTIIEKDDVTNSFVIEGNQTKVRVLVDEEFFKKFDIGKQVRVIGVVAPALEGEGFELKGEVVQDFSGLDMGLYKEYLALKKV